MAKEKKNLIINGIKILITILVFYFIFKKIPAKEIITSLRFINIKPFVLAILFGLLFTFFKILKWHLFLKDLEAKNSFLKSIESYLIGMSIGLITPARIGEVARIGNIDKEKRIEGISLVFLDKAFDLLAVLILAILGFHFFFGIYISILIGILIILSLVFLFNLKHLKKFSNNFLLKKFSKLIEGAIILKRKTLLFNFILSLLSYFLVTIEVYFLANSLEKFSFFSTLTGYPLVMLVNLIPITIGGLGIREGTAIYLLGKLSLSSATAFNSAFLLFLINTALPALLGVFKLNKDLMKNSKILIFIITTLGAILRIYKISERSIWLDEAITAQIIQDGIWGIILNRSQTGIHPPFYFILVYFWTRFFGDSEMALRSLSFIFGTFSIPLFYKFVKRTFDEDIALISSLFFSLSPFLIYFSQEARMYPLFTFLVLLSLNFVYDLNKNFSNKNLIKILIVNSLLLYTHFFSSLLIFAENIYIFIIQRKNLNNLKKWVIFQFINLLIFSPWIYVIITRNTPEIYQGAQKLSLYSIALSLYQIFFGFARSIIERENLHYFTFISFLIFLFLGILPPYKNKKGFFLGFLYFFIPFISLIIISSFGKSFYSSRYLSPFIPGILILTARGIKKLKFSFLINLSIIFLISLYFLLNFNYYLRLNYLNRPWRDVVSFIHENADSTHKVLITEAYYYRPFEYYNKGKIPYIPINPDFFDPDKIKKELSNTKKFLLVLSDANERTLKIKNFLDKNFKNKGKKNFYKVEIHLYED